MARCLIPVVVILTLAACGTEPTPAATPTISGREPTPFAAPTSSVSTLEFAWNRDHNHDIYVMNADGSGQTRLTNSNHKWYCCLNPSE